MGHGSRIKSCSSSPEAESPQHSCEKAYDGLDTYVQMKRPEGGASERWAIFDFGGATEITHVFLQICSAAQTQASSIEEMTVQFLGPANRWLTTMQKGIEVGDGHPLEYTFCVSVKCGFEEINPASKAKVIFKGDTTRLVEIMFYRQNTVRTPPPAAAFVGRLEQYRLAAQTARSHLRRDSAIVTVQTSAQVAFFKAIKEWALKTAMKICLAGLAIGKFVLNVAKVVVDGVAGVIIKALEGALALLGPNFFQIMDLTVMGGVEWLNSVTVKFGFNVDMWLVNVRIKFGFEIQFSLVKLVKKLFSKVKDALGSIFRL